MNNQSSTVRKIVITVAGLGIIGIIAGIYLQACKQKNQNVLVETAQKEITTETTSQQFEKEERVEDTLGKNNTYILPESNARDIQYTEILDFDTETLNLAKNEIYARHGFIFTTNSIAEYFNNCTWYKPSVEASQFQDSVFNQYEIANIRLLEDYETASGYTYPLKVQNGETVKVDLNGDGKLDNITLFMEKVNTEEHQWGDNQITITINDIVKKYENDCYDMTELYIVDVNTSDKAKEVCFEMWEPNDYTGSVYWQYTSGNELKKIYFDDSYYITAETDGTSEESEYEDFRTDLSYGIQYMGDGRITCCRKFIGITQIFVDSEYLLTEDGIFEYVDRIYENGKDFNNSFQGGGDIIVTLKKDLVIYKDHSMSSETFTIEPQELKILAVCKGHEEETYCWTKVELEDKSIGWIYPPSYLMDIYELFDGIWFSG